MQKTTKLLLPLCILLLWAAFFPSSALDRIEEFAPPSQGLIDTIDAYMLDQLEACGVPGAAVAIVHNKKVVHVRGYGRADTSGTPVSGDTPFALGSTTKLITALSIMQLAEAGRLDLDEPVRRYLPWFRVIDSQASGDITIRHLLYHTSGIPQIEGLRNLFDGDNSSKAIKHWARRLRSARLNRPVGSTFEYSNANYVLLGMVIQEVSGQSYESYIRSHVFEPLRMRHSFTSEEEAEASGMATGHRIWFGHPRPARSVPLSRGIAPAGGLVSSAGDLAKFLILNLNEGYSQDGPLVSRDGLAELHRGAAKMSSR